MRKITMLVATAELLLAIWATPARGQVAAEEFTVNAFAFSSGEKPTALAVGENGLILRSDDGGGSWEQSPSRTAAHLVAVTFADELTAYAVGGSTLGAGHGSVGVILKTDNGGLTWQAVGPSLTASGGLAAGRFWGVTARGSAVAAWCAPGPDAPGGLVLSWNGGKSWAALGGRVTALPVAAWWTDDDGGYALTADGVGWQWNARGVKPLEKQAPPGRLTAAHIVDGENWVAATESGEILTTKDGGRTWVAATVGGEPGTHGWRGFGFYESAEGWCGSVWPDGPQFTTNGGRTWKRPVELPPGPVRAVCFRDAWNGVAAGPFGGIYQTTDGGGTWKSVRGAPRRAGLIIFEPWGSVGDWPLVSMLSGDRGYRTLLWSATLPADESVIEAERKLRDAAEALDGSEAIVLGTERTARHDGSPGFVWPATLPHGEFAGKDAAGLAAALAEAQRRWRPTVVLSPSEKSEEAEEKFVGVAAALSLGNGRDANPSPGPKGPPSPKGEGLSNNGVRRWIADPRNATGARPASGAEGDYEVPVDALAPSENFGASHAVRAALAAQLGRQWPAPLAEALGYHRMGKKTAGPPAMSLLEDLQSGGEETRRPIPATAAYGLEQRAAWEHETEAFYPTLRAEVERGEFAAALRRTMEWGWTRANFQLPQTVLMDLGRRAAAGGEAATADEAFAAAAGLGARWGPRTAEAVEWILDRQAAPEWGLVAVTPSGAAASGRPDYAANYEMLSQVLPEVGRRADLQYERYRWLAAQGSVDEAALRRARQAAEASGDAVWAATVKMESWIQGGRRGEAPVAAVSLRPGEKRKSNNKAGDIYVAPTTATAITTASAGGAWGFENSTVPAGQMVDLGSQMAVAVREESGGLVLDFFGRAAQGAWVTIDMGRTGRTALAEPVVEWETPRVTRQATAGSPLWVRSAALWTRTEKDGRIMLRLGYAALGGRPPRGTVWLVTVRRETVPGLRPQVWPELKNGGCWAVMFD